MFQILHVQLYSCLPKLIKDVLYTFKSNKFFVLIVLLKQIAYDLRKFLATKAENYYL